MPFSWKHALERAEKSQLKRYKSLATCNQEWVANHVNLAKELNNESNTTKVETKKYIREEIAKRFKYGETPKPSVIIKRYNRSV